MVASPKQQHLNLSRAGDSEAPISGELTNRQFASVAVPVPVLDLLTYAVPGSLSTPLQPGMRCRVPLGRRSLEGVIVKLLDDAPDGISIRQIEAVVDHYPPLTPELLSLGRFVADYYLSAVGEVLKSMIPAGVGAVGRERLRITDAGAFAAPVDDGQQVVLDHLREGNTCAVSELTQGMALDKLWGIVVDLERRGWVRYVGRSNDRGSRFGRAYELASDDRDGLLNLCGRSQPGRRIVEELFELGRPASRDELLAAGDCGPSVLRRLVKLEVVREFVEVRSVSLDRHRLAGREGAGEEWVLTSEQQSALDAVGADIDSRSGGRFLIHGVTGSGKTEIYLRAARRALEQGRTALIMVPEIALVPALARQVRDRFGDSHAILHSGLSRQERAQEWQRIRSGAAPVVVGPRSSIFAPLSDLGLVVVDEEHDSSYKQESNPRYHGRDVAYVRAGEAGATLVLGSATPSMESRYNVERGRLQRLSLRNRVGEAKLPEGIIVDLRQEARPRRPGEIVFSRALIGELQQCLDQRRQAILLRNRRGYAPVLLCETCGHDHPCDDCGLARTLHRKDNKLHCHYCGSTRPVPDRCVECGGSELDAVGAGTERVEEQTLELFPQARVVVLDRDRARGGGLREVLDRFGSGEADILVGTQMVAKGHHFPNVSLAAVLNADTYLSFPDFRGVERAYALLAQLAGRSGRGDVPGKVIIQTRQPDHYAVRAALDADDSLFLDQERDFRRNYAYPPYCRLINIITEDRNRGRALETAQAIAERLRASLADTDGQIQIAGPQPPPLERLAGRWRFQVLLAGSSSRRMRSIVAAALPASSSTRIAVDVDPYQLL